MGICMDGLDPPGHQAGNNRHKELWTLVQLAQDLGKHDKYTCLIQEERSVLAYQV